MFIFKAFQRCMNPIRSRSTIAIKAAFSLLNCFNYISFDAHCSKHSAGHDVNVYFQGIPKARERYAWSQARN
jgi:hypothetical protein